MTFTAKRFERHMFQPAHAAQANGSCAAFMQSANSIIMPMDAGILASILISLLCAALLVRVYLLAVVVLVVLVSEYSYTPDTRVKAYL